MTGRHLLPPDHPSPPHCIPAYLEIEDLEARAQEADWTGNHDQADRLRKQADDLKASGDLWSPTF